jgi:hypothetical protein
VQDPWDTRADLRARWDLPGLSDAEKCRLKELLKYAEGKEKLPPEINREIKRLVEKGKRAAAVPTLAEPTGPERLPGLSEPDRQRLHALREVEKTRSLTGPEQAELKALLERARSCHNPVEHVKGRVGESGKGGGRGPRRLRGMGLWIITAAGVLAAEDTAEAIADAVEPPGVSGGNLGGDAFPCPACGAANYPDESLNLEPNGKCRHIRDAERRGEVPVTDSETREDRARATEGVG